MGTKYTMETPYEPQIKYHMSLGNTKIGKILNTNLQAGEDFINGRTTIQGSCIGCSDSCQGVCYARAAYRYDAVIEANGDNTYYAREDLNGFMAEVKENCNRHPSFKDHRWHSSGEVISLEYLIGIADVARNTKQKHYVYTKRYEFVNTWTKSIGGRKNKPENLEILLSPPFYLRTLDEIKEWEKNYNPYGYPLFIYDDGYDEEIAKLPHCPAVDKKGHKVEGMTCDKCRRCPNGMTTAVHAH